jgi:protein TonB
VPVPQGRPTEPVPAREAHPTERPPTKQVAELPTTTRRPVTERVDPVESAPAAPPQPPGHAATPQPPSPPSPPQPTTTQAAVAPSAAAAMPLGTMDKSYYDAVLERLTRVRNHPMLAGLARQRTSGQVVVVFTVDRDGKVLDAAVKRSSGHGQLDKAGLDLIRLASPMPGLPTTIGKEILAIEVPIRFQYN